MQFLKKEMSFSGVKSFVKKSNCTLSCAVLLSAWTCWDTAEKHCNSIYTPPQTTCLQQGKDTFEISAYGIPSFLNQVNSHKCSASLCYWYSSILGGTYEKVLFSFNAKFNTLYQKPFKSGVSEALVASDPVFMHFVCNAMEKFCCSAFVIFPVTMKKEIPCKSIFCLFTETSTKTRERGKGYGCLMQGD